MWQSSTIFADFRSAWHSPRTSPMGSKLTSRLPARARPGLTEAVCQRVQELGWRMEDGQDGTKRNKKIQKDARKERKGKEKKRSEKRTFME